MSEGPKYLVEFADSGPELFETLQEARDAFDAEAERLADEASDGWAEEAEYLPRLSVCYLLAEHSLDSRPVEEVEADGDEVMADKMRSNGWDFFAEGKVTEYPDPIAALTAERDHARSSVLRLSAMEWAAKAAREERDAAIAERDMHMAARIAAENAARDNLTLVETLRAEVAVLRATGRVTADDLITVCMGDCGAITEEDSDGCCAGCGNDTALVVGIGSSEAVLEAFRAREAPEAIGG